MTSLKQIIDGYVTGMKRGAERASFDRAESVRPDFAAVAIERHREERERQESEFAGASKDDAHEGFVEGEVRPVLVDQRDTVAPERGETFVAENVNADADPLEPEDLQRHVEVEQGLVVNVDREPAAVHERPHDPSVSGRTTEEVPHVHP